MKSMNNYLTLAVKYFKKQKKTATITILSIVVGTMIIGGTIIAGYALLNGFKKETLFDCNYDAVFYVNNTETYNSVMKSEKIKRIVTTYEKVYSYDIDNDKLIDESDSEFSNGKFNLRTITYNDVNQDIWNFVMVEGSEPKKNRDIIIPKCATNCFKQGKKVGDTITYNNTEYNVCGIYDEKKNSNLINGNNYYYSFAINDEVVTATDNNTVNMYVRLFNHKDIAYNVDKLAVWLGLTVDNYNLNGEMISNVYFQADESYLILVLLSSMMLMLIYIAMVIIRNMFSINVIERVREFAILKSIGADNKQLYSLFAIESMLSGVIGIPLGIIACYVVIGRIFDGMIDKGRMSKFFEVKASFPIICIIVFILIITLLLAIIEPFMIMRKTSILHAVNRNYAVSIGKRKPKRIKSGMFSIFGIEGEYAYKNARRNTKSFMAVVTSFVIALTIYLAFEGTFNTYFSYLLAEDDNYFDAVINTGEINKTKTDSLNTKKKLEDSDLFDVVEQYKETIMINLDENLVTKSNDNGEITPATLIDIRIYSKDQIEELCKNIIDGSNTYKKINEDGVVILLEKNKPIDKRTCLSINDTINIVSSKWLYEDLLNNNGIMEIASELAKKNNMEYTSIAECVPLFSNECETKSVKVAAIAEVNDVIGSMPMLVMTQEYFNKVIGSNIFEGQINSYNVKTKSATTLLDINSLLADICSDAEISFYNEEWEQYQIIKLMKKTVNYIVLVIGAVGVFFIINSLTNEHIRRKREYAILRAVGMDKLHLVKMILLEKGLMCMLALIIGSTLGNILSYAWVKQMDIMSVESIKYILPIKAMIMAFVVMLIITAVASIIPIITMQKTKIEFNDID